MSTSQTQQQQVTVGTVTGKQFQVKIRPTDTVRDVKIRIEEEEAIPMESQVLIFGEKTLKDTAAIRDLGIRGGSRLQLAVHMTAGKASGVLYFRFPIVANSRTRFQGPGPVARVRKAKQDDSVVVVLCKQSDGLYMLEFHMKEGEGNLDAAANQLLKLAQGLPPFILQELASNENDEDDEYGEYEEQDEDDLDSELIEDLFGDEEEYSQETSDLSRSESSYSSLSTSTFLSLLDSHGNFPAVSAEASTRSSNRLSRKSSASNSLNSRNLLEFSSSARSFNKLLNVKRREEFLLPTHPERAAASPTEPTSTTRIVKTKIRPATAISLMRLPKGLGPTITVVKSRPSTAAPLKRPTSSKEKEPAAKTKSNVKTRSRSRTGSETIGGSSSETIVELESHRPPTSRSKSVRFSPEMGPPLAPATLRNALNSQSRASRKETPATVRISKTPILVSTLSQVPAVRKSVRNSPQKRDALVSRGVGTSAKKPSVTKPPVAKATNCFSCNEKLGSVAVFKCKCSNFYCSKHRYSDRHDCKFDYKESGKAILIRENPKVGASKVTKI
ncbi:Rab5 GDP/GTP exchange factor [Podochytrium sp. JEL0797]|nr:Rab5 GDP/GTP exchange factor [Podochytrium sp. JEL0797]